MEHKADVKGWVYVVVCDPEGNAGFLGLYDKEKEVNFIPAFQSKEIADTCFLSMPRERGRKYEIQAVHLDELHLDAETNGFVVAMVDKDGNIIGQASE